MAREIKVFLIVITGLCVLLIGLYMQANDRREARLDKYLEKKLDKLPAERAAYVDLDPQVVSAEPERVLTKVRPQPEPESGEGPQMPTMQAVRARPISEDFARPAPVPQRTPTTLERPMARRRKIAKAKRNRIYIVKKGDTLSEISSRELGSAKFYMKIFKANRNVLKNPNVLPVGAKLVLPDPGRGATASATPPAAPAQGGPDRTEILERPANSIPRSLSLKSDVSGTRSRLESVVERKKVMQGYAYRVGRGETVYSIARKVYGDARRAKDILAANADIIGDPEDIPPGLRIRLPR